MRSSQRRLQRLPTALNYSWGGGGGGRDKASNKEKRDMYIYTRTRETLSLYTRGSNGLIVCRIMHCKM